MLSISCQRYHWVKVSSISLPTQRYSSAAVLQLRSHSSVCTVWLRPPRRISQSLTSTTGESAVKQAHICRRSAAGVVLACWGRRAGRHDDGTVRPHQRQRCAQVVYMAVVGGSKVPP